MKLVTAILCAACSVTLSSQVATSPLVTIAGISEHLASEYTEPSSVGFLFFEGEPIMLRVGVSNSRGDLATLRVSDPANVSTLFEFNALRAPRPQRNADGGFSRRAVSGDRFDNEQEAALQVQFAPAAVKRWSGGADETAVDGDVTLASGESIAWTAIVDSGGVVPGVYRIDVRSLSTDSDGRVPRSVGRVTFEVRRSTGEDRAEIARRSAYRSLSNGDYVAARTAVAELLRVHPTSAFADDILATIADGEGRPAEATRLRASATRRLRDGTDALLLKYAPRDKRRVPIDTAR
jgi:hypothetical protein